jgi:hypothetical protein
MGLRSYEVADALKQRFSRYLPVWISFHSMYKFYGTDGILGVRLARQMCIWRLRVSEPLDLIGNCV